MDLQKKAKKYTTKVLFGFLTKMGSEEDYIAGYKEAVKDNSKLIRDIMAQYYGQKMNTNLIEDIMLEFKQKTP